MLATLESIQILEKAEMLGKMIANSYIAEEYRNRREALQTEPETRKKIEAFTKMKDLYDDVQRFGRYHPDYKEIMVKTRTLKREMDMDENVARFRVAENKLQDLLDSISVLVARSVSPHVKVPSGNPFFDTGSSCGGSCGTGGGCGCSA